MIQVSRFSFAYIKRDYSISFSCGATQTNERFFNLDIGGAASCQTLSQFIEIRNRFGIKILPQISLTKIVDED